MQDMQTHVRKLREEAAECAMIRHLATKPQKQELFGKLAEHLIVLASQIEGAMERDRIRRPA